MTALKFTIPHDTEWARPDIAYADYQAQAKGAPMEEIEWNGKYKTVRELRDLAVFGLHMYAFDGNPIFVQMNKLDPSPDAFVMRKSATDSTAAEIGPIELTFFGNSRTGRPNQTLLERLTAKGGKFQKLPKGYALVIHLGIGEEVEHQAITDHLKSINATFQVFSIQEVASYPDTVSRLTMHLPELKQYDINIAMIANDLRNSNIPGTVTQVRGVDPSTKETQ